MTGYRAHAKAGENDCAIAAMATIFRREPGEVLVAAAKVKPTVWKDGLSCNEMLKVAKRLKVKATWAMKFDPETAVGVLWVTYNDVPKEHCVVLIAGWVIDSDCDPVEVMRYVDYCASEKAYGTVLLQVTT
jgi:hypothetical protein